jgi:integrase
MGTEGNATHREPWNKGKIVGQKAPFKPKDIWALRVRLQMENRVRELALLNLGIDSKLRGCDLVALKVCDVCHGDQVATRAVVMQHKTQRPVQFEITAVARDAVQRWIRNAGLKSDDFLFPSRIHSSPHLGTRQYARILEGWVEELGLDPSEYGTHSMRRTKATLIYRRTGNLRAVQLLLGHSKVESTVRYLGVEVDDALEISEQTEI